MASETSFLLCPHVRPFNHYDYVKIIEIEFYRDFCVCFHFSSRTNLYGHGTLSKTQAQCGKEDLTLPPPFIKHIGKTPPFERSNDFVYAPSYMRADI